MLGKSIWKNYSGKIFLKKIFFLVVKWGSGRNLTLGNVVKVRCARVPQKHFSYIPIFYVWI